MTVRRLGLATHAIHGKPHKKSDRSPVVTPVVQTSTFVNPVGSGDEVLYTRYGNNPNQTQVAQRLALLEGADSAVMFSSGMAATALAHLAVLRPGDHLLATDWIYGGTRSLFEHEFEKLGISITFVDPARPRDWKRYANKNTRAVFVETPTNPLARVIDLDPLAQLCRQRGMVFLVDSTFASPANFRPIEWGADLVIHSATKYLNGHSDVVAGAVAGNAELIEEMRNLSKRWGPSLDPNAAWLVERGMKTLSVRMERHNANALAFAQWADEQTSIVAVHYPGLPDHEDHELASRTLDGFGGIVGIQIKGGAKAADAMLRKLRLAIHAPSLGGVETLVSEPRFTSHAEFTAKQRKAQGIPDGFVRVSVGIEDVDDIIRDFERALATVSRT